MGQWDQPGVIQPGAQAPGRVIVFTSFRDSVGAIVDMFKAEAPLISARWVIQKEPGSGLGSMGGAVIMCMSHARAFIHHCSGVSSLQALVPI